jgi:hypothetical protein
MIEIRIEIKEFEYYEFIKYLSVTTIFSRHSTNENFILLALCLEKINFTFNIISYFFNKINRINNYSKYYNHYF